MLRERSHDVWLFGDNLAAQGYGGMAREMRGEPNAVGVPTKKHPTMQANAFFSDDDFINITMVMELAITRAEQLAKKLGGRVIVPVGIGQGLARLPECAPKIWAWLRERLGLGL
jgi:hypothetical protein